MPGSASEARPVSERDFDSMNQANLRKAATEFGVHQRGVLVPELREALKLKAKEMVEKAEPVQRDFEAMKRAKLRRVAKDLGVFQKGRRARELKDACKRVAGIKASNLTAWMRGNARVAVSAAGPPDSNLEDSGDEVVLVAKQEQQQQTTLSAWMAGNA